MEKCDFCGEETEDLYVCESCGSVYCKDCSHSPYLCLDCYERIKWEQSNE